MSNVINLIKMQFENLFSLNKTFLVMISISLFLAFSTPEMFQYSVGIIIIAFTNLTIGREKICNIDNLIKILPIKESEYILSRYIFGIIGISISCIVMSLISLMLKSSPYISVEATIMSALVVGTVMVAIVVPITTIVGPEKCRLIIVILTLAPIFFVNKLPQLLNRVNTLSTNTLFLLTILSSLLIMYVSYLITVSIYKKIEF